MKEVWFFLIRTNTDYVKSSYYYDSFEEAQEAKNSWRWNNIHEEPITPIMKGYMQRSKEK